MTTSFDERAADWDDDPKHVERARAIAAAIRGATVLGPHLRVLEYGAGTGLLAQQLAPDVGHVTITDPSEGMLAVARAKADAGVFGDADVFDLDLTRDPIPDGRYDLAVTAMALHHVLDLTPVLRGFAELLVPGGTLCIADLDDEDGSFHGGADAPRHDVHDGFDRDELAGWLTEAGFGPTRFDDAYAITKNDRSYGIFLATTTRSS